MSDETNRSGASVQQRTLAARIHSSDRPRVLSWLTQVFGELVSSTSEVQSEYTWAAYRAATGAAVFLHGSPSSGFVEVEVSAAARTDLPWDSSTAFARAAARALGLAVDCDPGEEEYPRVDPLSSTLLRVTPESEHLFRSDETSETEQE